MAPDRPDPNAQPDPDWPDWSAADGVFPAPPPPTAEEEAAADARAEADILAGRVVSHEKVVEWLRTWGKPDYKPYPREWFE